MTESKSIKIIVIKTKIEVKNPNFTFSRMLKKSNASINTSSGKTIDKESLISALIFNNKLLNKLFISLSGSLLLLLFSLEHILFMLSINYCLDTQSR